MILILNVNSLYVLLLKWLNKSILKKRKKTKELWENYENFEWRIHFELILTRGQSKHRRHLWFPIPFQGLVFPKIPMRPNRFLYDVHKHPPLGYIYIKTVQTNKSRLISTEKTWPISVLILNLQSHTFHRNPFRSDNR